MFHVVLFEPEIAPNTGNIIRLCANCGAELHLVEPLGFDLDDRRLRRAGLDYAEWASVRLHQSYDAFVASMKPSTVHAFTTKARRIHSEVCYGERDFLLFGPETRGLPGAIRQLASTRVRIPMVPGSRSLNLANAVAIVCYEAWRQHQFAGRVIQPE